MKANPVIQIIISLLALFIGYPNGGSVFILAMTPLALYLVFSENGDFIPAIMIHCASSTSIIYIIFCMMVFVCFKNYKNKISNDSFLRIIFWLLVITMPIFLLLVFQRFTIDNDNIWGAIGYSACYLCFWCFLYCFILSDSISFSPVLLTVLTLFLLLISFIPNMRGGYTRLAFSTCYALQATSVYKFLRSKNLIWIVIFMAAFSLMFANEHATSFTEFGITVLSTLLVFFSFYNRKMLLRVFSGPIIYIAIFVLILWGSLSYLIQPDVYVTENGVDFSSVESFTSRFRYKLFGDRAPFWSASLEQLATLKPILPMHDIPDIIALTINDTYEEASFGAHCTPLQLLRIFGFLMGGILCYVYMMITIKASKYLILSSNVDSLWTPYICASLSSTIMYFLTGTVAMLGHYALFTFGVLGIAYSKYKQLKENYESSLV